MSASRWLAFAASPTFALMALLSFAYGKDPLLCSAMCADATGGMAAMYALMSLFHAGPWLAFRAERRRESASPR